MLILLKEHASIICFQIVSKCFFLC